MAVGSSNSKNQLYGDASGGGKFTPQSTPQPPAQLYGAQGMRGRLIRMGIPSLQSSHNQIGRQSVQDAFRRIK